MIGLDVRMLEHSGIGTTIRELLRHLPPDRLKRMVLFHGDAVPKTVCHRFIWVPYRVYGLSQHFFYPGLIRKSGIRLFHMPHYDVPYFIGTPFIATVHDLIHLLYPEFSTKPFSGVYSKLVLSRVAKKAERILVVSENTKRDLIRFEPSAESKIRVVSPGVDKIFSPPEPDAVGRVVRRYELTPPYFLYVGNLRKSKNTDGLLRVYEKVRTMLKDRCPSLVLVGRNFLPRYAAGFPDGVRHLGLVPTRDLPALYGGATVFLFPSLYEGFGLPPLEAMACGTPVIASNRASIPDVCADAAVLVDPSDEEAMGREIVRVFSDESERRSMVKKGFENVKRFSWKSFADSTWAVYEDVLGGKRP